MAIHISFTDRTLQGLGSRAVSGQWLRGLERGHGRELYRNFIPRPARLQAFDGSSVGFWATGGNRSRVEVWRGGLDYGLLRCRGFPLASFAASLVGNS